MINDYCMHAKVGLVSVCFGDDDQALFFNGGVQDAHGSRVFSPDCLLGGFVFRHMLAGVYVYGVLVQVILLCLSRNPNQCNLGGLKLLWETHKLSSVKFGSMDMAAVGLVLVCFGDDDQALFFNGRVQDAHGSRVFSPDCLLGGFVFRHMLAGVYVYGVLVQGYLLLGMVLLVLEPLWDSLCIVYLWFGVLVDGSITMFKLCGGCLDRDICYLFDECGCDGSSLLGRLSLKSTGLCRQICTFAGCGFDSDWLLDGLDFCGLWYLVMAACSAFMDTCLSIISILQCCSWTIGVLMAYMGLLDVFMGLIRIYNSTQFTTLQCCAWTPLISSKIQFTELTALEQNQHVEKPIL
ncbi:hypothetical protein LOK49_LG12G02955 [Camellia lanceoleosa]|uniref:Uncharacterized protein n=1 Tax=Camellia lanceoleosa TaxID=1840588 RepID=A0ACC0FRV6_9ERIC|nr:hypothetical protein LOK49_LG12G02955 [Camellia lanceoleosa]